MRSRLKILNITTLKTVRLLSIYF